MTESTRTSFIISVTLKDGTRIKSKRTYATVADKTSYSFGISRQAAQDGHIMFRSEQDTEGYIVVSLENVLYYKVVFWDPDYDSNSSAVLPDDAEDIEELTTDG